MKNTKIPLDIIWMNEKKQIIHMEQNVPICTRTDDSCPQYRPNDEALYVLELAGGRAEKFETAPGIETSVPGSVRPSDAQKVSVSKPESTDVASAPHSGLPRQLASQVGSFSKAAADESTGGIASGPR